MQNRSRVTTSATGRPRHLPAMLPGVAMAVVLLAAACGGGTTKITTPTTLALSTVRAFPALSFVKPVEMLQAPGDNSRWFVIEQGGTVRVFSNQDNVASASTFVDISGHVTCCGETGLLGMAFHPGFPATDQRAYLSYTATVNSRLESRLAEFRTADGGQTLDPASEVILLTVTQPETNHKGGHVVFGPDGYLYMGLGDGGGEGDAHGTIGNGQDTHTLLGKVLRIDVDTPPSGSLYSIPPTGNPYAGNALCGAGGAGSAPCPEIYAVGVRNPWKFSFDRSGGALWIADVGQDSWEEIDRITASANLGWRCREGAHAFNSICGALTDLTDPVAEYAHPLGEAIIGGFVYRGSQFPGLRGRYVFGDEVTGLLFNIDAATPSGSTLEVTAGDPGGGVMPSTFAEDQAGELYEVDYNGGVYRLSAT